MASSCFKCGNILVIDWVFCNRCGAPTGIKSETVTDTHIFVKDGQAERLILYALADGLDAEQLTETDASDIGEYILKNIAYARSASELDRHMTAMSQRWSPLRVLQSPSWVSATKREYPKGFSTELGVSNVLSSLEKDANDKDTRTSGPDIELAADFISKYASPSRRSDALQAWCDASQLAAGVIQRIRGSSSLRSKLQDDISLMSRGGLNLYMEQTNLIDRSAQRRILANHSIKQELEMRLLILYMIEVNSGRLHLSQIEKQGIFTQFDFATAFAALSSS